MIIRFQFKVPENRLSFIGNEVEDGATIDLEAKEVRGYYGSYTSLPGDPSLPAERHTSSAIRVVLTDGDVALIKGLVDAAAAAQNATGPTRYEMRLSSGAPTAICRVDPYPVTIPMDSIQTIMGLVLLRAKEQGIGGAAMDSTVTIDGEIV
jgi:hypothetical protein